MRIYSRGLALYVVACAGFWLSPAMTYAEELAPTFRLAIDLEAEGDHSGSALEFRRIAIATRDLAGRAGYYWASGYEYWRGGEFERVDKMLDEAENSNPRLGATALLLRGMNELSRCKWEEASFYMQSVLNSSSSNDIKMLAARKLSTARLRQKDIAGARNALEQSPIQQSEGLSAIEKYDAGRDKCPKIGSLLGLIPGFGYFYSGEYANGFRSIILNALFIYGMVDTADKDQWGAFAVVTFFEFTWYFGSIYGGIDAAHRYNRARLDSAVGAIHGEAEFEPDLAKLPVIALRFRF